MGIVIDFKLNFIIISMDKQSKKQKYDKMEKKLQNRDITIYEILQEDIAVDWYKGKKPGFIAMLDVAAINEMIGYLIKQGPANNPMRSYKIPMIVMEILSSQMTETFDLFWKQDPSAMGGIVLGNLLKYFQLEPNYVISGYVVKILMNLMLANAAKVLEFLMKHRIPQKMYPFLSSHSVAQFLLRIMIVQDILLNNYVKERIQIFQKLIGIYAENSAPPENLQNTSFILTEAVVRLWTQKHKELGRFSSSIFRLVELVIEENGLHQQQQLMSIIMKHITQYSEEAPYLIVALYKKILKALIVNKKPEMLKTQFQKEIPKFSMKNLKLLQSLNHVFASCPTVIAKYLATSNPFPFLLDYIIKYQWNSLVLVEIQKAILVSIASKNDNIYRSLITQAHFLDKIKELIRSLNADPKFGRGYSGFLHNIMVQLQKQFKNETKFAQKLAEQHQEVAKDVITNYFQTKQEKTKYQKLDIKVVHDIAKPNYNIDKLPDIYKEFFSETEAINKQYILSRPKGVIKVNKEDPYHEIEKENELVIKLLTQLPNQNSEDKKMDSEVDE